MELDQESVQDDQPTNHSVSEGIDFLDLTPENDCTSPSSPVIHDNWLSTGLMVKVGTVRKNSNGTNIATTRDGKPIFTGQRELPVKDVLNPENLPFHHPITPEVWQNEKDAPAHRYYGCADLDGNFNDVMRGNEPLFAGGEKKTHRNMTEMKRELKSYFEKNADMDKLMQDVAKDIPVLGRAFKATGLLCAHLSNKQIPFVAHFSGCKGTRVLWKDQTLWRKVVRTRKDNGHEGLEILKQCFGENRSLIWSLENDVDLDGSVHGKGKGIKSDLLPHPFTGVSPIPLVDFVEGKCEFHCDEELTRNFDECLNEAIRWWWREILSNPNTDVPLLKTDKKQRESKKRLSDGKTSSRQRKKSKTSPVHLICRELWDYDKLENIALLDLNDDIEKKIGSIMDSLVRRGLRSRHLVSCKPSKNNREGRLWAQDASFQNMPGWIRRICSHLHHHDVDMSNAGPRIMAQIVKTHMDPEKNRFELLHRCAEDRSGVFEEVLKTLPTEHHPLYSESKLKKLFITGMNGGKHFKASGGVREVPLLTKWETMMEAVARELSKHAKFKHIHRDVESD
ncbi:MAG: hypothetical protein AAGM67_06305, partial [Bacteroidota bacterium]